MMKLGRRSFGVSGAGVAVGLLAAPQVLAARPGGVSAPATPAAGIAEVPAWLLAPLGPGSQLGSGWRIAALQGLLRGGYVLELEHQKGERVELHLCRREAGSGALASTEHLDLFVMNGVDGHVPSDEELGLVVMSLARRIRENEARQGAAAPPPADLMSHAARVAAYFSV
jgi:hypothetical protein